jgi:hypothetical protein
LNDFDGEDTFDLGEAIKIKSQLSGPAHQLKFVVAGSDESELDLYELRKGLRKQGISFSFAKLIDDYNINQDNPILVISPSK